MTELDRTELEDFLRNNQQTAIQALEGFKKSTMIMETIIDYIQPFPNKDLAIVACKSYEQLKDKQKQILKILSEKLGHEVDEQYAPIVASIPWNNNDDYLEYYTTKDYPNYVYKKSRVILMTQKAIQQNHHNYALEYEGTKDDKKRKLKWIFVDEFDSTIGIIPSLHYLLSNYLLDDGFNNKDSLKIPKKDFLTFLSKEYAKEDYYRIKNCGKNNIDKFFIAYWIEHAEAVGSKVTFATSEILAIKMLEEIGFNTKQLDSSPEELLTFLSHKVHTYASECVTSHLYNRLNDKQEWGTLGFKTIISDKFDNIKGSEIDFKVVNHMTVRGSNSYSGTNILTIISYIPRFAIKRIMDTLNSFTDIKEYDFDYVEKMWYRDRLCQAVGRVIGYRGIYPGKEKEETWLLIHETIYEKLKECLLEEEYKFPYTIDKEFVVSEEFKKIELSVINDKRINNERLYSTRKESAKEITEETNKKIDESFIKDETSTITTNDIRRVCKEKNIQSNYTKKIVQPCVIINYFGLKKQATTVWNKETKKPDNIYYVKGLRIL